MDFIQKAKELIGDIEFFTSNMVAEDRIRQAEVLALIAIAEELRTANRLKETEKWNPAKKP